MILSTAYNFNKHIIKLLINIIIYMRIFLKRMSFLIKVKKYFPGFDHFLKFIIDLSLVMRKNYLIFV